MLPQLDISHYTSQVFWLLVSFCILIVAMRKVFIPKVNSDIKEREDAIASRNEVIKNLSQRENELNEQIRQSEKEKISKITSIYNGIEKRYATILSEQMRDLQAEQTQLTKAIKAKYETETRKMIEKKQQTIDMLARFAVSKIEEGCTKV
ncbi:MAG: hypothetical protein IJS10_03315 [Alphaproteobacteria bacterium]|nr:hypothetical protein [Alphaproteobacteria bacterium]